MNSDTFSEHEYFRNANYKIIKLELLDQTKSKILGRGSGFITDGTRYQYGDKLIVEGQTLWTCWHVITGLDPRDLKVKNPPNRKFIRGIGQRIEIGKTRSAIGGAVQFELPLYDSNGAPKWCQETGHKAHPDLNAIGIRVPQYLDAVRLPINLPEPFRSFWSVRFDHIHNVPLGLGETVYVGGYPYGYSSWKDVPFPTFLKKAVATSMDYFGKRQLDGIGSPGMSGGPVLKLVDETNWRLVGIYYGVEYPDYDPQSGKETNDKFSALGGFFSFSNPMTFLRTSLNDDGSGENLTTDTILH